MWRRELFDQPLYIGTEQGVPVGGHRLQDFARTSIDWRRFQADILRRAIPAGEHHYARDVISLEGGQEFLRDGTLRNVPLPEPEKPLDGPSLLQELARSLHSRLRDTGCTLLLSGGLDSALLAYACRDAGIAPLCVTAATGLRQDVDLFYAAAVCRELKLEHRVVRPDPVSCRTLLLTQADIFEDPRPDILNALPLVAAALASEGDVMVSGEPADSVLGAERAVVERVADGARQLRRLASLRLDGTRAASLVHRAARATGSKASLPYGDPELVARAISTPWTSLLDTTIMRRGAGLGGPGFKMLQRAAAKSLRSDLLIQIADRTKLGLPSTARSWKRAMLDGLVVPRSADMAVLSTLAVHYGVVERKAPALAAELIAGRVTSTTDLSGTLRELIS